jgi:small-conductance mechanosensitive channel
VEEEPVQIILPPDASPELIERVRAAFPEAVTTAEEAEAAPEIDIEALVGAAKVEETVASAVAALPRLPDALASWWSGLPGGGLWFCLLIAVAIAVAYAVERGALLVIREGASDREQGVPFRRRLPRGLFWFAKRLAGLALFAFVATVVARAIFPSIDLATRDFARAVLDTILYARFVNLLLRALAAPGAPGRRLMGFTDEEAAAVGRAVMTLLAANLTLGLLRDVEVAAGGRDAMLVDVLLIAINGAVAIWFFLRVRAPVEALIVRARGGSDAVSPRMRGIARRWEWIYVAVAIVDVLLKAIGAMGFLGPDAAGVGPTLLTLVMTPLIIAGIAVWRAESVGPARAGWSAGAVALVEGAIILAAAVILLRSWGLDPFAPPGDGGIAALIPGVVEAVMIVVIGIALWRVVNSMLGGAPEREEGGLVDEENVGGGSRLDTVLPILRGFALAVIGVLTALSALSALGVEIAPLLAGAGVLGLAIGFGAQRLVADVISGLFYLYEDAFRIGEYIETKSGKGVVEKIGLRSVRLRHHRGPVFTIPFSDMGTIQNHSRDWVKIKFTFNVPVETDVEMVRKLVKKVGQELEADPELEGKFLEPLKSQGAVAIAGRSFTIGCKFTSRPGQQFLIRRKAYAALQRALAEKGIDLYMPQLTLNPTDPAAPLAPAGPDGAPMPVAPA